MTGWATLARERADLLEQRGCYLTSLRLSVDSADPAEGLRELSEWLGRESDLRGLITPVSAGPGPGELGVLADALVVAVGSGGLLSVLASSLKTFLALPRRGDLRIVVSAPGERIVEIDAKHVRDVESLIRDALGDTDERDSS